LSSVRECRQVAADGDVEVVRIGG